MTANVNFKVTQGDVSHSLRAGGRIMRVGRSRKCEINLNDPKISRGHCIIEWVEESLRVSDIGSVNGIFFNGEKVERAWLKVGDTIQLGDTAMQLISCESETGTSTDLDSGEVRINTMSSSDCLPDISAEQEIKMRHDGIALLAELDEEEESDVEDESDDPSSNAPGNKAPRRRRKVKSSQMISLVIFVGFLWWMESVGLRAISACNGPAEAARQDSSANED